MPSKIDATKRAAIADAIRAGHTRNAIAREHNVGAGTVTAIAREHSLTFDRSATKNATAAKVADNRSRRAQLAARLLDEANAALDDMHRPSRVFAFGGKDNEYNERTLDRPPITDRRSLMTMAAVAIDKHVVIERHDADATSDEAVSMLGRIADGLTAAYHATQQTSDEQEVGTDA